METNPIPSNKVTLRSKIKAYLSFLSERLTRYQTLKIFESISDQVRRLRAGDRIIFYILAVFLIIASFTGLYTLEQSLLVQVPAYGGSLTEGIIGSPRFINPLLAITDADRDLTKLTYAGLMGISGTGSLVPVLAKSYSVSPDGKTYTFILKKNIRFSDETPISSSDVVFTVQKAQDTGLKSPEYANWSGVSVQAIDQRTVKFTLTKPYTPFLGLTTLGILPAHLWQGISNEEFPFSNLETNPVSSGPFVITSLSRDASGLIQDIQLRDNKYYALGRPYLSTIHFKFFAGNNDLALALANGSIESAYGVSTPFVHTTPYARVFGVFWNSNQNKVYARIEVRKALSLAINRSQIVKNVLGGYATPIMGPIPPGTKIRQVPIPQSDNPTAKAANILENAGWRYNGNTRVWENKKTKQTLGAITIRTSNVPELKSVASAVRVDWEKLGITVNIELYEPGDLSQNVIRPRKYEALLYGMVIGRDQDLYAFWDSHERNDPGLNIALYANKTVDSLLEKVRTNLDPVARTADLQKIEDTIASEYPAVFIYAPSFTYAIPKNLYGVELPQITSPADRFATIATWYRSTDAVWPFFVQKKK